MIAMDDVVVSITKGHATFTLKIAVRRAAYAVPEILELFRAVVDKDTVVTHHVERSRFAPESKRTRERITSVARWDDEPQVAAASAKPKVVKKVANGNTPPPTRGRGRPRNSDGASA